jgi:adenine-specific DNA-methyltransferase
VPAYKRYRHELRNVDGVVPQSLWTHDFAGHTDTARKDLREVLFDVSSASDFATPKPAQLIQRVLQITTDKDSLILDSFAGSGTTGHAVLKQNAEDGGTRKFILVEMDTNIAKNVTAERVKRVSQGYTNAKGDAVPGLSPAGGGFQFCTLSAEPLFTPQGQIRDDVTFAQLAEFVWFAETGTGFTGNGTSPLLGTHEGRAIYLLYNGILKDKSVGGGNVLTSPLYEVLPSFAGPKTIYAAACRLGAPRLQREQIVFKQTPYALEV